MRVGVASRRPMSRKRRSAKGFPFVKPTTRSGAPPCRRDHGDPGQPAAEGGSRLDVKTRYIGCTIRRVRSAVPLRSRPPSKARQGPPSGSLSAPPVRSRPSTSGAARRSDPAGAGSSSNFSMSLLRRASILWPFGTSATATTGISYSSMSRLSVRISPLKLGPGCCPALGARAAGWGWTRAGRGSSGASRISSHGVPGGRAA